MSVRGTSLGDGLRDDRPEREVEGLQGALYHVTPWPHLSLAAAAEAQPLQEGELSAWQPFDFRVLCDTLDFQGRGVGVHSDTLQPTMDSKVDAGAAMPAGLVMRMDT